MEKPSCTILIIFMNPVVFNIRYLARTARTGVSLEIGNFCTLSALFNQSWFVRG